MSKKILIFVANPRNAPNLRSNLELKEIENIFKGDSNFSIVSELVTTFDNLYDALALHEPNIVHFIGHGKGENGLVLENSDGKKHLITTEELADIFKDYSQYVECLFLNACHSMTQAKITVRHISCTIGMQGKIKDDIAREFAKKFYSSLKLENNYEKSFRYARRTVFRGIKDSKVIPQIFPKTKDDNVEKQQFVKKDKSSLYLQIELFLNNKGGKFYTFQAWFYKSAENVKNIYEEKEATLNNMPALLEKTLDKIHDYLVSISEPLTIEFFLPQHLLNHNIEHYCFPDNDFPIGYDYKIVIRSWERLRKNKSCLLRCCRYWNSNKEKLQAIPECYVTGANEIKNSCSKLENGIVFFILTSPPTEKVLIELIKAGTPIILWFRKQYPEKILHRLKKELLNKELKQLPELVRKVRIKFWEANDKKHNVHLSLLWEDTDRLPPELQKLHAPD